ncbi:MAG: hypothetical protein KGR26_12790, partial [Cyanobacteria bacterium REEB65]|nr:hypothetical protein [Cyanobacteria bacterium REEB65]
LEVDAEHQHLRIRFDVDNLTTARELFVHHEANQDDAPDFFYRPVAKTKSGGTSTRIFAISPQGTLSAVVEFPLAADQHPGLLVVGADRPPYEQVAIALNAPWAAAPEWSPPREAVPLITPLPLAIAKASGSPLPGRRVSRRPSPRQTARSSPIVALATKSASAVLVAKVPSRPKASHRVVPLRRERVPSRTPPLSRPRVVYIPPIPGDRVLAVYPLPDRRSGRPIVLWRGRPGSGGYGWSKIHREHPDVLESEIAYTATYPQQIWTDGRSELCVRWDSDRSGALVIQVSGSVVVSAQWATAADVNYWVGAGRIYPRLLYSR